MPRGGITGLVRPGHVNYGKGPGANRVTEILKMVTGSQSKARFIELMRLLRIDKLAGLREKI
jgi:hypothetical protein